jgi:RimJ/RimL family protein N-acetyltransferase
VTSGPAEYPSELGFGAIDDRSAEVALVVRDESQQQGIGTELASRVLQAAEDRGFDRFITHVLSDNLAIRKLLTHVGDVVSTTVRGRECELAFVRRRPAGERRAVQRCALSVVSTAAFLPAKL